MHSSDKYFISFTTHKHSNTMDTWCSHTPAQARAVPVSPRLSLHSPTCTLHSSPSPCSQPFPNARSPLRTKQEMKFSQYSPAYEVPPVGWCSVWCPPCLRMGCKSLSSCAHLPWQLPREPPWQGTGKTQGQMMPQDSSAVKKGFIRCMGKEG